METQPMNVLFLCTGNSARSIMAEALLNGMAPGRFRAYSAGSRATRVVNRFAIELLQKNRLPTDGLRSKGWEEFAAPEAPEMHFVFTVCSQTAGEACPVWPGQPMTAYWGTKDPAAIEGDVEARRNAFFRVYSELQFRLLILVSLPLEKLDRLNLQRRLDDIGLGASAAKQNAA